jgi:hypothetical protein
VTLQEAKTEYNSAMLELTNAKASGDPEAIASAKARHAAAQAAISEAKVNEPETAAKGAMVKELADLKASRATLWENFCKQRDELIKAHNLVDELKFEIRQLRKKYGDDDEGTGGTTATPIYGPKPTPPNKPGPIDCSDLFPDWDEFR